MKQIFRKFALWKANLSTERKEAFCELGWGLLATGIYGAMLFGFYVIFQFVFD